MLFKYTLSCNIVQFILYCIYYDIATATVPEPPAPLNLSRCEQNVPHRRRSERCYRSRNPLEETHAAACRGHSEATGSSTLSQRELSLVPAANHFRLDLRQTIHTAPQGTAEAFFLHPVQNILFLVACYCHQLPHRGIFCAINSRNRCVQASQDHHTGIFLYRPDYPINQAISTAEGSRPYFFR